MLTAPNHDWAFYAEQSRASDAAWLRSLSAAERFSIYEGLFDALRNAPSDEHRDARLERWRWDNKLRERRRQVDAFAQLDRWRRGRSAPNDAW